MNQHIRFALLLLGLASALPAKDLPISPRALTYPLDARRDGQPFEPEPLLRWCGQVGINVLVATVCEGPAAEDAHDAVVHAFAAGCCAGDHVEQVPALVEQFDERRLPRVNTRHPPTTAIVAMSVPVLSHPDVVAGYHTDRTAPRSVTPKTHRCAG